MGNNENIWEGQKGFIVETLWCRIECLRKKMHVTALAKGISHPDVLMVSQRLDEVINEFYNVNFAIRQYNK